MTLESRFLSMYSSRDIFLQLSLHKLELGLNIQPCDRQMSHIRSLVQREFPCFS